MGIIQNVRQNYIMVLICLNHGINEIDGIPWFARNSYCGYS